MSSILSKLINLGGNLTGVLGLSNGGTAKALTAAAGGLVWTDADSMEVGAAGTGSDWALSGGTGAPTFSSTTTTLKKFSGGLAQAATIDTSNTNVTLSNTSNRYILFNSFSASRDVTLPTTSIVAGEIFTLVNTTAFDMVVKASGGTALSKTSSGMDGTVQVGYVVVMALVATPTAATDWRVLDAYESYAYSTTFTFDGTGSPGTSGSCGVTATRDGNTVTIQLATANCNGTSGTGSISLTANTAAPTRMRPTGGNGTSSGGAGMINNSAFAGIGTFRMFNDGKLELRRDYSNTAFTNASVCGMSSNNSSIACMTYTLF